MSSPVPFRSLSPGGGVGQPHQRGAEQAYELYNLGTELRLVAGEMKDYSYLVLRLPTEESWAFAQPRGANLAEPPPPFPLWIPRRDAVVEVAKAHGLEIQCVAEDTAAFHNWTSRFYPSVTLTLDSRPGAAGLRRGPWMRELVRRAGNFLSAVGHGFIGPKRSCFVFQKVPGAGRSK